MSKKPELTTRMTLHLNGGSEFSQLNFDVLANGKPTGIAIVKRTNGSPEYKYTAFDIIDGDEVFDALVSKGAAEWIYSRLAARWKTRTKKAPLTKDQPL